MTDIYEWALPMFVVGTCIILFLWVMLLYQLFLSKHNEVAIQSTYKNSQSWNFYRRTAIVCYTLCLATGILDTLHAFLSWKNHYPMLLNHFTIIKGSADLTYFSASVSMNMILFGRLYFTFKYSTFALTTWTNIFIAIQIGISMLITLGYSILMWIVGDEQIADDFAKPMIITIIINDFILSVSMLLMRMCYI